MQQFSREWDRTWDFNIFHWNKTYKNMCNQLILWFLVAQDGHMSRMPSRACAAQPHQQCLLFSVTPPRKRKLISWKMNPPIGIRVSLKSLFRILRHSFKKNHPNVSKCSANSSKQMNSSVAAEALQHWRDALGWFAHGLTLNAYTEDFSSNAHFWQVSNIVCFPCGAEISEI